MVDRGGFAVSLGLVADRKPRSPPADRPGGHTLFQPSPARAGYVRLPRASGVLASASSYSPRLPGRAGQWHTCGFRQRLQLRGSDGLSPSSPKPLSHFIF
jgi:hypothetical protein